jgi:hypothetical protein
MMRVFWYVTPCRRLNVNRYFGSGSALIFSVRVKGLLDSVGAGTTILQHIGDYLPVGAR